MRNPSKPHADKFRIRHDHATRQMPDSSDQTIRQLQQEIKKLKKTLGQKGKELEQKGKDAGS